MVEEEVPSVGGRADVDATGLEANGGGSGTASNSSTRQKEDNPPADGTCSSERGDESKPITSSPTLREQERLGQRGKGKRREKEQKKRGGETEEKEGREKKRKEGEKEGREMKSLK